MALNIGSIVAIALVLLVVAGWELAHRIQKPKQHTCKVCHNKVNVSDGLVVPHKGQNERDLFNCPGSGLTIAEPERHMKVA